MKKKGMVRIILGAILVGFQVLGIIGNLLNEGYLIPPIQGSAGYSAGYILGYFLFGIIGIILLAFGINARKKSINAANAAQYPSPNGGTVFTDSNDMTNKL
ncbi:MAG: hypothetical protein IJP38_08600 [Oscillospiraceae bacterium]|nr:hypothetical protein [Oscillospiraceae bacterium]